MTSIQIIGIAILSLLGLAIAFAAGQISRDESWREGAALVLLTVFPALFAVMGVGMIAGW